MEKSVYFVSYDPHMHERQSDGVEMCVIPELGGGKIYFYCSEYSVFWGSIEDAGDFSKSKDFKLTGTIRPATLSEIHSENLCNHVNLVKEYVLEGGKVKSINYVYLQ